MIPLPLSSIIADGGYGLTSRSRSLWGFMHAAGQIGKTFVRAGAFGAGIAGRAVATAFVGSGHQVKADGFVRSIAGIDGGKFSAEIISRNLAYNDLFQNRRPLGVVKFELHFQDVADVHMG